ncbi:phospholipid scramblase 3-like [Dreissena polymorpha]|uniref:phospholipid scramblase 3-like n=1 Tax=Dreissena polymorpha TaxID=45954 RepID=UPI0022645DF7|nr:phospholipid scramblase 3-like [Dreissena polymorpha]
MDQDRRYSSSQLEGGSARRFSRAPHEVSLEGGSARRFSRGPHEVSLEGGSARRLSRDPHEVLLEGGSARRLSRGPHEVSQLTGSSLERKSSRAKAVVSPVSEIEEIQGHVEEPGEEGEEGRQNKVSILSNMAIAQRPSQGIIQKQPMSAHSSIMVPLAIAKLQRKISLNPRVMTPPGLEVLSNKAMVAIRQQMEMDIKGGCGTPNTYKIWDTNDEQMFFASEESGCLCRWACGPARQFSLDVFSTEDDLVLNFHRTACRCDCCCCLDCFLCLQKLYVVDCLGRTLGAVKQKFSVFSAKFDIVDHDNNVLFKVLGPCCPCRCATELFFQILNKTGERQLGRIQKKWGGDRTDNVNVDHEYFDVTFPPKLDGVDKALIIGAAFLVNFMYLEMS